MKRSEHIYKLFCVLALSDVLHEHEQESNTKRTLICIYAHNYNIHIIPIYIVYPYLYIYTHALYACKWTILQIKITSSVLQQLLQTCCGYFIIIIVISRRFISFFIFLLFKLDRANMLHTHTHFSNISIKIGYICTHRCVVFKESFLCFQIYFQNCSDKMF